MIYVMEAFYDHADFLSLVSKIPKGNSYAAIVEFEVENKYAPADKGSELMSLFERELTSMFPVKSGLDSKCKQSVLIMGLAR